VVDQSEQIESESREPTGWAPWRLLPPTPPAAHPPIRDVAPETPPAGESPRSRRRWIAIASAAALLGAGFGAGELAREDAEVPAVAAGASPTGAAAPESVAEPAAAVAAKLLPSIVQIDAGGRVGSGVVYDAEGHVLTAAHVVGAARYVSVHLSDGAPVEARVLGTDPSRDIAVLVLEGASPAPAPLGEDDGVAVGQLAVALGSPYGLEQSVTAGIVSALDRSSGELDGLIQTDAPINPGSSGGALADREARVIGINVAITTHSGGNEGVGFAVPIGDALEAADRIVRGDVEAPSSDVPGLGDLPFDDLPFGPGDLELPESLRFDGLEATYLPPGFSLESSHLQGQSGSLGTSLEQRMQLSSSDGETISVDAVADGSAETRLDELRTKPGGRSVLVGDHDGYLRELGSRVTLGWIDRDGLYVVVDAPASLAESELLRLAEGLR
jgi:putative serine protease PepD